jgi:hypothetical protein
VGLIKAGRLEDAKRVLKIAVEVDPDLRIVAPDYSKG